MVMTAVPGYAALAITPAAAGSLMSLWYASAPNGEEMGVVVYVVLTVAVFAALGLAQKLVERL